VLGTSAATVGDRDPERAAAPERPADVPIPDGAQ
jgi:hypothetical protein